jgi:hypothetical protein
LRTLIQEQVLSLSSRLSHIPKGWLAAVLMLLLLILLAGLGWWQGTSAGPQLQVPMFYDDHYVYPRPWTQEEEAPGVPEPAPVSTLYGPNRASQSFISGMDRLAMLRLWLGGPDGTPVQVSLAGDGLVYRGEIQLEGPGRYYDLAFPPIAGSKGQSFILTLYAPQAAESQPVTTRAVGGDRLDGTFYLNEYPRPGNLELYTYGRGLPGRWWLQAAGEQLLPAIFALRIQQYKPLPFKGAAFPLLLGLTLLMSGAYLVLSRPAATRLSSAVGWSLVGLLLAFLTWQIMDQRLKLPFVTNPLSLEVADSALALAPGPEEPLRLVYDLPSLLWTARREPETRFVETHWEPAQSQGVIEVPAESEIHYSVVIPLNGRFQTAVHAPEQPLRFTIRLGEETIYSEEIAAADRPTPVELDLTAWGGQAQTLSLLTESVGEFGDETYGMWLSPRLSANADWLLTSLPQQAAVQSVNYQLAPPAASGAVELVGYQVNAAEQEGSLSITLYWRGLQPGSPYATVFIHLLDETGQIVAQSDGQPVSGTYPIPAWQPDSIIVDTYYLSLAEQLLDGSLTLALGLYDPETLVRWPVTNLAGEAVPDDRILLSIPPSGEEAP